MNKQACIAILPPPQSIYVAHYSNRYMSVETVLLFRNKKQCMLPKDV